MQLQLQLRLPTPVVVLPKFNFHNLHKSNKKLQQHITINTNQQSDKENKNNASHTSNINKENEDTVNYSSLQNTDNEHIQFILFDTHIGHKTYQQKLKLINNDYNDIEYKKNNH